MVARARFKIVGADGASLATASSPH